MAAPVSAVYKFVGVLIVLLIVFTIVVAMIYSVPEYRIATLLVVGLIKARIPSVGRAMEYFVRTFVWF